MPMDSIQLSFEEMIALLFVYVCSGALQPILLEVINYNGACDKSTMIFVMPTYLGMSLSFLAFKGSDVRPFLTFENIKSALLLCSLDVFSMSLNYTGLVYAGSLLFSILYSSCTMWTAIFSRIFLRRDLKLMQWLSVVLIVMGLGAGSFGAKADGADVSLGVILILTGSMLHSLTYILSEKILLQEVAPIPPEILSSLMGLVGMVVYGSWQIVYTLPNFKHLIIDEITYHDGSYPIILTSYIALTLTSLVHSLCFYYMIATVGATTTGVTKGLQTILVSVISHFAFCGLQSSQCFNTAKCCSMVIVVTGVYGYSYFKNIPVLASNNFANSQDNGENIPLNKSRNRVSSFPLYAYASVSEGGGDTKISLTGDTFKIDNRSSSGIVEMDEAEEEEGTDTAKTTVPSFSDIL